MSLTNGSAYNATAHHPEHSHMWIFLNDAFLSVVAHTDHPDHLHVRGRVAGDIERVFPDARVTETPGADYRFRADVPRHEVADVMARRIEAVDYPNFKASIDPTDGRRRHACGSVWTVMRNLQERAP